MEEHLLPKCELVNIPPLLLSSGDLVKFSYEERITKLKVYEIKLKCLLIGACDFSVGNMKEE